MSKIAVYNFQRQFVAPILLGRKPHTLRRRRKNATEPGDLVRMYTGLRTKKACRFGESPCVKVEPIIIYPFMEDIWIADKNGVYAWLLFDEVERLAKNDGFSSTEDFFAFFQRTYKASMLDDFEIIWWDLARVEVVPGVRMLSGGRLPSPDFVEVKHG